MGLLRSSENSTGICAAAGILIVARGSLARLQIASPRLRSNARAQAQLRSARGGVAMPFPATLPAQARA